MWHFFKELVSVVSSQLNNRPRKILPCLLQVTHWQNPQFHAYYPLENSYPAICGDILCDGIGSVGFSWVSRYPGLRGENNSFLPPFIPSFIISFLPSFLPSFINGLLPSFLLVVLPSSLPFIHPSFLPSLIVSFTPSFLLHLDTCADRIDRYKNIISNHPIQAGQEIGSLPSTKVKYTDLLTMFR